MDPNALSGQIAALDQSYNPTAVYNQVTSSLGIPDARTRVQALQTNLVNSQNAINAVDPSVTGRTQNSVVTEAQRERLVNMEKAPLQTAYNTGTQDYNTANTNLNSLQAEGDRQVSQAAADYQTKRQSLATQLDTALKQQAAAEATRQFNVQQAANAAAAAAKAKTGGTAKAAAPIDYNATSTANWIKYIHANYHGQNWGQVAAGIKAENGGTVIGTGSNLDQALHYIYTGSY